MNLIVFISQQSRYYLTRSSAVKVSAAALSSGRLTGEEFTSKLIQVVRRIHFLEVVELRGAGSLLAFGYRPTSGPMDCPQF